MHWFFLISAIERLSEEIEEIGAIIFDKGRGWGS